MNTVAYRNAAEWGASTPSGLPEAPNLERMEPWKRRSLHRDSHRKSALVRCGWCWIIKPIMRRHGRRSARWPRRSAVQLRPCGAGFARPSGTRVCVLARRAKSGIGSRRWSGRTASFARPMRSFAHHFGLRLFCPGGARPPAETMKAFIDEHRGAFGVVPICRAETANATGPRELSKPIAPARHHVTRRPITPPCRKWQHGWSIRR